MELGSKKERFDTFLMLMQGEKGELTNLEKNIILCHSLNTHYGLICVNQDHQTCEFPTDWRVSQDGVHSLNYRRSKSSEVLVEFKFIDCIDSLSINFLEHGSQTLYHVELPSNCSVEQATSVYETELLKLVKPPVQKKVSQNRQNPMLVNNPNYRGGYQPGYSPLMVRPFQPLYSNPFGQQEYVGPQMLGQAGRGQRVQGLGGRVPPGARFDPVDPFNHNDGGFNDFNGFDQFGKPRGGFGGGFGSGGFGGGGFGGGFA